MSETEVQPAVIAAMTFSEKILQATPTSWTVPLPEGGNQDLLKGFD